MAVERILLKTVYCFECQRFVTVLMDAMKCPKCGNRFQYSPVGYIEKKFKTS